MPWNVSKSSDHSERGGGKAPVWGDALQFRPMHTRPCEDKKKKKKLHLVFVVVVDEIATAVEKVLGGGWKAV